MRILVDTKVFLDLLLKRPPYYNDGVAFINKCKKERHGIYINAMSFRDIEYILRKKVNKEETYKKIINSVYGLITKIIPLTPDDVINGIFEPGSDFEDTLIANSAELAMLDCIVTSNKKDYGNSKIPVFTLKEFNKLKIN